MADGTVGKKQEARFLVSHEQEKQHRESHKLLSVFLKSRVSLLREFVGRLSKNLFRWSLRSLSTLDSSAEIPGDLRVHFSRNARTSHHDEIILVLVGVGEIVSFRCDDRLGIQGAMIRTR